MMSGSERLVYMANQIARNFEAQGETAAASAAEHIALYWDPRMRAHILDILAAGGEGLSPLAAQAVTLLRERQGAARAG
jgi:formate dehydrogenase subunit delta